MYPQSQHNHERVQLEIETWSDSSQSPTNYYDVGTLLPRFDPRTYRGDENTTYSHSRQSTVGEHESQAIRQFFNRPSFDAQPPSPEVFHSPLSPSFYPSPTLQPLNPNESFWSPAPSSKPVTLSRPSSSSNPRSSISAVSVISDTLQHISSTRSEASARPSTSISPPTSKSTSQISSQKPSNRNGKTPQINGSEHVKGEFRTQNQLEQSSRALVGEGSQKSASIAEEMTSTTPTVIGETSVSPTVSAASLPTIPLPIDFPFEDPRFATVYALLHSTLLENAKLSLQLEEKTRRVEELSIGNSNNLLEEALATIVYLEDDLTTSFEKISSLQSQLSAASLTNSIPHDDKERRQSCSEEQYKHLETQFTELKTKSTAKIDSLRLELDSAQKLLATQQSEIDNSRNVQAQLVILQRSLDESGKQLQTTQKKLDETLVKNQSHHQRNEQLVEKLKEAQKEIVGLKGRAKNAEQSVKTTKMKEAELKAKLEKLEHSAHKQAEIEKFKDELTPAQRAHLASLLEE
ncbi:hypothetical protein JCM5350_003921 [Sporobolomyces pararoseus]